MARCMECFIESLDKEINILVATSGDTGSAVAHGFYGVKGVNVIILYPKGKVSNTQEKQLTKKEYHELLAKSKMVFSANLQETLGISAYEGALVGAIPMMPDRLSYTEMYDDDFKYPSEWTESFDSYTKHKSKLIEKLKNYMVYL